MTKEMWNKEMHELILLEEADYPNNFFDAENNTYLNFK